MKKGDDMTQSTKKLTMGSLFDGISGFPLASVRCGIEPIWASEIEPFPILVSRSVSHAWSRWEILQS